MRINGCWANVNRRGDWNTPHVHPDAHIAGVFYLGNGNDGTGHGGGRIVFADPRPQAQAPPHWRDGFGEQSEPPVPGSLLLFPSWLRHHVTPHGDRGAKHAAGQSVSGPRVSISFNVALSPRRARGASAGTPDAACNATAMAGVVAGSAGAASAGAGPNRQSTTLSCRSYPPAAAAGGARSKRDQRKGQWKWAAPRRCALCLSRRWPTPLWVLPPPELEPIPAGVSGGGDDTGAAAAACAGGGEGGEGLAGSSCAGDSRAAGRHLLPAASRVMAAAGRPDGRAEAQAWRAFAAALATRVNASLLSRSPPGARASASASASAGASRRVRSMEIQAELHVHYATDAGGAATMQPPCLPQHRGSCSSGVVSRFDSSSVDSAETHSDRGREEKLPGPEPSARRVERLAGIVPLPLPAAASGSGVAGHGRGLRFEDPRPSADASFAVGIVKPLQIRVVPEEEGSVVLFPVWLGYYIPPLRSVVGARGAGNTSNPATRTYMTFEIAITVES